MKCRGERFAGWCHRQPWVLLFAVFLHLWWGALLVFDESPLRTTALAHMPLSQGWAALALLSVGALAGAGLYHPRLHTGPWGLALLMPQQLLLLMSAFSAVECVAMGAYADGTVVPRLHLASDQAPAVLAMVLHTFALCGRPAE